MKRFSQQIRPRRMVKSIKRTMSAGLTAVFSLSLSSCSIIFFSFLFRAYSYTSPLSILVYAGGACPMKVFSKRGDTKGETEGCQWRGLFAFGEGGWSMLTVPTVFVEDERYGS